MTKQELFAAVSEHLEEAAAFARGGDMTGAKARARYAKGELEVESAALGGGPDAEELVGRVDRALVRYDRLTSEWQEENAERESAYLARERAVIEANPSILWKAPPVQWNALLRWNAPVSPLAGRG